MPATRNHKTVRRSARKAANSIANAASHGVARAVQPSRKSERLRLKEELKAALKAAAAVLKGAAKVTSAIPAVKRRSSQKGQRKRANPGQSSGTATSGSSTDAFDTPVELESLASASSTPNTITVEAPVPTTALAGQSTTPTAAVDTVDDAAATKEPDTTAVAADEAITTADEVNHGVVHALTAENLAAHQAANEVASRVEASAASGAGTTSTATTPVAAVEHVGDEKTDDGKTVTDDGKTDDGSGPRMAIDYGPTTEVEQRVLGPHQPKETIGFKRPSGYMGMRYKKVWSKEKGKVVMVNLASPLLPRPGEGTKTDLEHYSDFTKKYMTIDPVYAPEKRGPSPLPRFCFTADDWERELAAVADWYDEPHAQSLAAQDTITDEAPGPVPSAAQAPVSLSTPASASLPTPASASTLNNQSNPPTTTGSAHPQPAQTPRVPAGLTRGMTMTDINISSTPVTASLPNGPKVITIKRRSGYGWKVSELMTSKKLARTLRDARKLERKRAPMKKAAKAVAKMALACGLGRPGAAINKTRGRRPGSPNLKRGREGDSLEAERPLKKRKTDDE